MVILPLVGVYSRCSRYIMVDLPLPVPPSTAAVLPAGMVKDTSRSTGTLSSG